MDRKALQILFRTYWTSSGWRPEEERGIGPEEFRYAKQAGVMFDPVELSHGRIVAWALDVKEKVRASDVADAFLASLTSRRLDLRSALGSYAVLRHFADHEHLGGDGPCEVCGEYGPSRGLEDLNVLNFERFKWGGVRHDHVIYAAFDLERFLATDRPEPTPADIDVMRSIVAAIEGAEPDMTASRLEGRLGGLFKSNKDERDVVVALLGYCGLLKVPDHPGFWDRFVPIAERELPPQRFIDMAYPACWWRGRDGVDRDVLNRIFPSL